MQQERLSRERCYELFREHGTPPHVIDHCEAVSVVATAIAEQLNKNGEKLDVSLIESAGLIHDVARLSKDHEVAGFAILKKEGYLEEAEIVKQHMHYKFDLAKPIDETDIVCLGDRVVKENEFVGIDERIEYLIEKNGRDDYITKRLYEAKDEIKAFISIVEEKMGMTLTELFRPSMKELLMQVEKPARYVGGEVNSITKEPADGLFRFCFVFPDLYEIGMSYLGLQIIYDLLNREDGISCERAFAPAPDMEDLLRRHEMPLFTLENKTPLNEMDAVGFTLQYEMSFTNILNILELSGITLKQSERGDDEPIIMAGGPCAYNPEPLSDFFDLFIIGDGEVSLKETVKKIREYKEQGLGKQEILLKLDELEYIYIPSFYVVEYNEDETISAVTKIKGERKKKVRKAFVQDLEEVKFPVNPIVPTVECVHDRAVVETFRGCTRGCRFCQAGMIYRPVRERSKDEIIAIADAQLDNTGHDELSLLSLSTSDHSDFENLAIALTDRCIDNDVSLSLPSLRLDSFSFEVLNRIQKYHKTGLTFAPEAGTQRLRDVINKGITDDDIYDAVRQAIELGWRTIKLYFMIGLPTETDEDLMGIVDIAQKIVAIHKESGKGGRFNVNVSVSNFVPKAFTPFQWSSQDTVSEMRRKHDLLAPHLKKKNISFNYHDDAVSKCEAVFARGDRRCGELLLIAHELGCRFDGWSEYFDPEVWKKAYEMWSMEETFYTERSRARNEILPWDVIDSGILKDYLAKEMLLALEEHVTGDCRKKCLGCGVNRYVRCPEGGAYE